MGLSRAEKKKRCVGCRANRYNMGRGFVERPGIDAPVTVDECWHLETAESCDKSVYYSPGDYEPSTKRKTLTCWHNKMGYGTIIRRS